MAKSKNTILRVIFAAGPDGTRFQEFKIVDRTGLVSCTKVEDQCTRDTQVYDLEFEAGKPYMVLQYTINNLDYSMTRYDDETPAGYHCEGMMPYNGKDEISEMLFELRSGVATRESVLGYMNSIADRIANEAEEERRKAEELLAIEKAAQEAANAEAMAAEAAKEE